MPRAQASRELEASLRQAWGFVAEPHHFSDWWPGIAAVEPDRRGLAAGARWQVRGADRPTLLRAARREDTLLVLEVDAPYRVRFSLVRDRIEADLQLEPAGSDRTLARLAVQGPWLFGFSRSLPRQALGRLHALCQTAAGL